MPFISNRVLRIRLDQCNAGAEELEPSTAAIVGIFTSKFLGLNIGNALLLTVLIASASYIAVPAAVRLAAPKANMSLLLPMSLGITFTINVTIGIPVYFYIIEKLWSM